MAAYFSLHLYMCRISKFRADIYKLFYLTKDFRPYTFICALGRKNVRKFLFGKIEDVRFVNRGEIVSKRSPKVSVLARLAR